MRFLLNVADAAEDEEYNALNGQSTGAGNEEWASSCKSTETNRRIVEMKPRIRYVPAE